MKIYKKILIDIGINLLIIALMQLPLFGLGLAPIMLIVSGLVFDYNLGYKLLAKIPVWRVLPSALTLYIGYRLGLMFQDYPDNISYVIIDYAFYISLAVTVAVFVIYQIIVLIALKLNKD